MSKVKSNHYKKCSRCQQVLHISEFPKNKSTSDGYGYHCKECTKHWTQKLTSEQPFKRMWRGMMERCIWGEFYNGEHNHQQWGRYGGRGIQVSEELQDYETFERLAIELEEDFIKQYGHDIKPVLDRINPDGNYERGNIRFVSDFESAFNRRERNDPSYEHLGINLPLSWWARVYFKEEQMVQKRVSRGWTLARALNTPREEKFISCDQKPSIETQDKVEHIDDVFYLNGLPIEVKKLCEHFSINVRTFRARYFYNKWDLIKALTTKV